MMKRDFISTLCFLFLLFSLSFAEDRGYGVEVRSTSPEILEIEPGRIVTGTFVISNNSQEEEEFIEELKLPAGWQKIVSDEFPLSLNPEEQRVRIAAFLVPHTSPAGRYLIGYSVRSQRDYNITDSDSIWVVVLPVIKLEIVVEKKPDMVIAGESYGVRCRLLNKGNSSTKVKLEAKSNPAYPLEMDPADVTLELGESQVIRVEVKTDEQSKQKTKSLLEIKAETDGLENGAISTRQTLSVEILPRITGELNPYHKLPIQATLISAGRDGNSGFQAEFSGRGSLDEGGKRRVDFLFRGPDIQDISRHGRRDEYRLSYHQKCFDLHFGDRSYSLSPLTQRFSYGRGVEANFHHKKIKSGAFYLENRWGQPKRKGFGSYFKYQFNNRFGLRGNFLNKNMGSNLSSEGYDEEIYSIQAEIKPGETLNLDLEFGFSESNREKAFSDLAFRIDLNGQLSNQIRYSFEKIYADPEYFGYYKDVNYTTGTIAFPIYHKLRGNISYRSYENNLDLDPTKELANREKSYQGSIFYSFPFGTHLSLKYKDLTREDCALPPNFKYEEKALKLGLTQAFSKFNLNTHIETGEFEDKLLNKRNDDLERYSLYASFRPSPRQSYSVFTRIGHSSFTQYPEWTKSLGVSTRWYIKDNISFTLNYRKDNAGSENQKRDDLFSTFTYVLRNNHELVLRNQWSNFQKKKEFSFLLMYSVPFKIPVSKKKSIGILKGKVYDEEKPERMSLPGVILTANEVTAITNENGEFVFPSLVPGIYFLRLEKSSIGLNRVSTQKLPIMMEIKGGKTKEIEIGVLTSCGISGRVAVFTLASDKKPVDKVNISEDSLFVTSADVENMVEEDDLKKGRRLGNTLVEITDGEEVLRQLTDDEGRFSFEDIRPGKWILKVYGQDLPLHHYLEQDEFQVELKPGEEKEITIRVLPRLRPIQIIEEGKIEQDKR